MKVKKIETGHPLDFRIYTSIESKYIIYLNVRGTRLRAKIKVDEEKIIEQNINIEKWTGTFSNIIK